MSFWTLTLDEPITLCEPCALEATNMGFEDIGQFGSMKEAAFTMSALMALIGEQTDITSSDVGACGHCGKAVN